MARLIVSSLAQSDNSYILTDLAGKAGPGVAAQYAADFEALYERLAAHPDSGPLRPHVGQHVRIGVVSPFIVIYEHDRVSSIVTLLRIVHGRRRITGKLLLGDEGLSV